MKTVSLNSTLLLVAFVATASASLSHFQDLAEQFSSLKFAFAGGDQDGGGSLGSLLRDGVDQDLSSVPLLRTFGDPDEPQVSQAHAPNSPEFLNPPPLSSPEFDAEPSPATPALELLPDVDPLELSLEDPEPSPVEVLESSEASSDSFDETVVGRASVDPEVERVGQVSPQDTETLGEVEALPEDVGEALAEESDPSPVELFEIPIEQAVEPVSVSLEAENSLDAGPISEESSATVSGEVVADEPVEPLNPEASFVGLDEVTPVEAAAQVPEVILSRSTAEVDLQSELPSFELVEPENSLDFDVVDPALEDVFEADEDLEVLSDLMGEANVDLDPAVNQDAVLEDEVNLDSTVVQDADADLTLDTENPRQGRQLADVPPPAPEISEVVSVDASTVSDEEAPTPEVVTVDPSSAVVSVAESSSEVISVGESSADPEEEVMTVVGETPSLMNTTANRTV